MEKILLTSKNFELCITEGKDKAIIQDNMILTPGAKDKIRDLGIEIIYCKNQQKDELISSIKKLLREEYSIVDNECLNSISNTILNKINSLK